MEESLEILTFELDQLPSSEEFESQIEAKNVPAVFKGCIKDWKAFSKWNPTESGLDSLQELVGSSAVEVMLSRTAPVFYGDIRSHERVPVPFATFIGLCKQHRQRMIYDRDECSEHETHNQAGWEIETPHLLVGDVNPQQMYLAQAPILNTENEERIPLAALKEDIQTPEILRSKALSSVNLWMNNAQAKSSTHYDPHHNLLCIVAGCKQVVLWPPSASALLYPMPVYGEASNHSSVTLEAPDFSVHPRAKYSMEYSQKVVLHAGDALFIPEGWFHQVDSEDLTIAVNFWWRSNIMCSLSEHMDAYYLRRILRRLTDREMNQLLDKASLAGSERLGKRHMAEHRYDGEPVHKNLDSEQPCETESHNYIEKRQQGKIMLHELGPSALQALHELVSLVHHRVNVIDQSQPSQSTSTTNSEQIVNDDVRKNAIDELFCLEDDSVAKLLWTLKPSDFQDVCLAMAHNFPRTLEGLILHLLSPVGAEVLTRKFDELDKQFAEEDRSEFYQVFYRAFDDQFTVMDKILNGKELFARQAFNNTLNKYLGVKL